MFERPAGPQLLGLAAVVALVGLLSLSFYLFGEEAPAHARRFSCGDLAPLRPHDTTLPA